MNSYIKHINSKILAGFFLSLFLFANTPKKFVHDAVTHHQHSFHNHSKCNPNEVHISALGFHCQADNLVVEAVYGINIIPGIQFATITHPTHYNKFYCSFVKATAERTYLRGPPIC